MVSKVKRIDTYWRCNNPPKCFYFWSWNAGMQHLPCYCVVHETWKSLQNSPDAIAWCKKISAQTTNIDKKYIQQMQSKCKAHAKNILVHLSDKGVRAAVLTRDQWGPYLLFSIALLDVASPTGQTSFFKTKPSKSKAWILKFLWIAKDSLGTHSTPRPSCSGISTWPARCHSELLIRFVKMRPKKWRCGVRESMQKSTLFGALPGLHAHHTS